jgi:hypothetical protein
MMGWLSSSGCEGREYGWLLGVREVDWGWCQSLWRMKEHEGVVVVIRGEGAVIRHWHPLHA